MFTHSPRLRAEAKARDSLIAKLTSGNLATGWKVKILDVDVTKIAAYSGVTAKPEAIGKEYRVEGMEAVSPGGSVHVGYMKGE